MAAAAARKMRRKDGAQAGWHWSNVFMAVLPLLLVDA
jgi:hypothetical protein